MFLFSQEMRPDQAALIPPALRRGRGLSGAGSISRRPGSGWCSGFEKGGALGGVDTQSSTSPNFFQIFPEP